MNAALREPLREALAELVAADDAHQAWCLLQRLKPRPPLFDPSASFSSAGIVVKEDPEREAIIARINSAWEAARAALSAQAPPAPESAVGYAPKGKRLREILDAAGFGETTVLQRTTLYALLLMHAVDENKRRGTPQAAIGAQAESVSGPEPTAYPANWECIPRARVPAMSAASDPGLARKLLDVACRIRVGETLYRDDELVDEAAHALAEMQRSSAGHPAQAVASSRTLTDERIMDIAREFALSSRWPSDWIGEK